MEDLIQDENLRSKGDVFIRVEDEDGNIEMRRCNTVMVMGRHWLARVLAGQFGGGTDFYITHMTFGQGGYASSGGREGPVDFDDGRTGLFNPVPDGTIACSPSNVPEGSIRVTFTGRLSKSMANGYSISEMGLLMKNGALFAMVTFPPIVKTETRTITINWTITILSGT